MDTTKDKYNEKVDISHIPNGMEQNLRTWENMTDAERGKEIRLMKQIQESVFENLSYYRSGRSQNQSTKPHQYMVDPNAPKSKNKKLDAETIERNYQKSCERRRSQGWDGIPFAQKLKDINADAFARVEKEMKREAEANERASLNQHDFHHRKPQYPIDDHRFTMMLREACKIANLSTGVNNTIDWGLMMQYAMTFDTDFECYLTNIGVSDKEMGDVLIKYDVYHKGIRDIVFFRENKHGKTLNGNIITIDVKGKMEGCRRVFSHHFYYDVTYKFGTAFFGGHLLGKIYNKKDLVIIVQDEITALLGAIVYPDRVWLALGTGQNLTEDHLKLLENQRAILYPNDMALEFWEQIATKSKFPNVDIKKTFVDKDINEYLVNNIKERRHQHDN